MMPLVSFILTDLFHVAVLIRASCSKSIKNREVTLNKSFSFNSPSCQSLFFGFGPCNTSTKLMSRPCWNMLWSDVKINSGVTMSTYEHNPRHKTSFYNPSISNPGEDSLFAVIAENKWFALEARVSAAARLWAAAPFYVTSAFELACLVSKMSRLIESTF